MTITFPFTFRSFPSLLVPDRRECLAAGPNKPAIRGLDPRSTILEDMIDDPADLDAPILALRGAQGHELPNCLVVKVLNVLMDDLFPDSRYPWLEGHPRWRIF